LKGDIPIFSQYKKFIDQYVKLNRLEWALIQSKLKVHHYKKGEIIHCIGDVCRQLMFINTGVVRSYFLDPKGKDFTWSIYFNDEDSTISNVYLVDYDSFINQKPSRMSFEVLEDCELVSTNYDDTQFIYAHSKKGERLGRLMAELAYSHIHNLIIDQNTRTATERFLDFVEKTPYLAEKVPQYHIASYLGIAPQSLSRLKKKLKSNLCE